MNTTRRNFLINSAALGALSNLGLSFPAIASEDGTLRIAISKQPGNLDPTRYVGLFAVQSMIFEPLVRYGEGGKIEPALAESWTVSEDGKVLTFKLRQNAVFSDETPWNAEAMKWNLDRWIGKEGHSWLGVSAAFERLDVIDEYTVALHLKEAVPAALSELTIVRPVRFLSPKSVAGDGSFKDAVGTGPWKITRNDAEGAELVRHEEYWGEKPAIKNISLVVMPNPRSRVDAVRAGQIDVTGGTLVASISPQDATTLEAAGVAVVKESGTDTMVLGFNPERPIFEDELVREAISLCIDREAVCTKLLKGFAQPTMNLFPEVIPNSGARYPVPARDVEKAKELLEQAGWTGDGVRQNDGQPLKLELVISEDAVAGSRALGEVIQSFTKEAGIDLSLRLVDHVSRHDDIPQMKYDLALFITSGAPYDPFASLPLYFLSTFRTGTDGKMFMDKDQLDPLIVAALKAKDEDREAAFQAFYDWLHERHAIAPIYHASRIWARGPRVADFSVPPTEYELPFAGVRLKADG